MKTTGKGSVSIVALFLFALAKSAGAADIYKADNDAALNDPQSWEGCVLPGPNDRAVFDERVTANRLTFWLTGPLELQGMLVTNRTESPVSSSQTMLVSTNGSDAATLAVGAGGVNLSNSGMALTWNVPLVLSDSQTWLASRNTLTFKAPVSGTADWVLAGPCSNVYWDCASEYAGSLSIPDVSANGICRFSKAGALAKTFMLSGPNTSTRLEWYFPGTVAWASLFADRSATVSNVLITVMNGATLQFTDGDQFSFPGGRFVVDNGNAVQNGGTLQGAQLQVGYQDFPCDYTLDAGDISLTSYLITGNRISSVLTRQVFRQNGGTVSASAVGLGNITSSHLGIAPYEMNNGALFVGKPKAVDTGIRLSWNQNGNDYHASGAFLMNGGTVHADNIAFGRYGNDTHAVTNAYSLFKMRGGTLYLGQNGIYTDRSWNNGVRGAGYGVKVSGGTLGADDHWAAAADILLSDLDGGAVFQTEDASGVAKTVLLNGSVYGSGGVTKRGGGSLILAGPLAYRGVTRVEEGSLVIQPPDTSSFRWTANSLDLPNSSKVLSWQDIHQGVAATNSENRAPVLVKKELNGHNVVRFTSASTTYLAVAGGDNPLGGATSFTIALVFKTSTQGVNSGGSDQWYRHTGLVDGEQPGKQNDWGLTYNAAGQVCAGAGDLASNSDTSAYTQSGYSVADGQPHVVIYTWRGTNMTVNLDGRSVTVSTAAASVVPRMVAPMRFGSVNGEANKYFNGDIAEVRIFRNQALSSQQQARLGMELAATYGVAGTLFEVPVSVEPTVADRPAPPPDTPEAPLPYPVEVWDASTLVGEDDSDVAVWTTTGGNKAATLDAATINLSGGGVGVLSGRTAPKLARYAMNGKPAVRFSAEQKSVLGIAAADNPLAGCTNFTVALVLRSTAVIELGSVQDAHWYRYASLLDAEEPTQQNDWGISFGGSGRVHAGLGNLDATLHSKPFDLNDGEPHVVVVSYNVTGGRLMMAVDGATSWLSVTARTTPRNVRRLLLGSTNGESGKFFTGDIAEIRLYPECVLTSEEMAGLSQALLNKYGIPPIPTGGTLLAGGSAEVLSSGFDVSSGASLVFPRSSSGNAYTLKQGQTLAGEGTVRGSVAVGEGGVLDIGQAAALSLDDLRLQEGARVVWHHTGGAGQVLNVNTLAATGTLTLEIAGGQELSARVPVLSYQSATGLENVTWQVLGGKSNSQVMVNPATQTLDVVSPSGTLLKIW